ncbi:MAG: hypothetical protein RIQ89_350 [Bacteroidota bacterium]|jgi:DNA repair protein RadC
MESNIADKLTIKSWAEEDRPREKLLLKGRTTLSDAELIAILIGSGNAEDSAVELSKKILKSVDNNLHNLAKLSINDLLTFKGIGEAKAVSIVAALELGRRRKEQLPEKKNKITTSNDAYEVVHPVLSDLHHEEFFVVLLNRANHVLAIEQISKGGFNATIVDSRILFKYALDHKAVAMILAHNHPSGNLNPSEEDKKLTAKLQQGAKLLDLNILDHIIIGHQQYYSFADNGLM